MDLQLCEDLLKVLLEKFNAFTAEVWGLACAMSGSGDHVEGEVLIGFDEIVDNLVG
jgi:hypothetical protein